MTHEEIIQALHAGHVPPKPLNKKPPRYSASTVKQFKECERKHFFEQICGIEVAPGPALLLGTKVHSALERYLKHGTIPGVGPNAPQEERLASSGLSHLPMPGTPNMFVEHTFKLGTWPNGPEFTGTADLIIAPELWGPDPVDDENATGELGPAELYDHKTTSGYARGAAKGWVLTASTLPDDVQNIAYSMMLVRKFGASEVRSKWVYYDKTGAPATLVTARMVKKAIIDKWKEKVLPVIGEMHAQHTERPSLKMVQPNLDACSSFGGCAHRSYCIDYKEKRNMGKLSDSLLSEHKKITKEKETKTDDLPPLNPPPLKSKAEASPFQEVERKVNEAQALKPKTDTSAAKVQEKAETPKAPAGAGFALFIACEPIVSKRPKVMLAKVLAPLEEQVAKANKVAHIGLVKYDAAHHLCAALDGWLADNAEEWDGANVVVGRSALHVDVAERVLLSKAISAAAGLS